MNAVVKEVSHVTDEATLKGLDYHVFVDVSSSTERDSKRLPGRSRLDEMKEEVHRIIAIAGRYDNDGITFSTFGSDVTTWDNVTTEKAETVLSEVHSGGQTFVAKVIRAIQAKATGSQKNVVAVIFTDGEASDEDDTFRALRDLARTTGGRPKVGIVFVQVGNDPSAAAFLSKLDNMKDIPDMVATVPVEKSEGLEFGQFVWLALNA